MAFVRKHITIFLALALGISQSYVVAMHGTLKDQTGNPLLLSASLPSLPELKLSMKIAGTQRAQHILAMFQALAQDKKADFVKAYAEAQKIDFGVHQHLAAGLKSDAEKKQDKAFAKLQRYAQTQLDILTDDALTEKLDPAITQPRNKMIKQHMEQQVAELKNPTDKELDEEVEKACNEAVNSFEARGLAKKEKILRFCYGALRDELEDTTDSDDFDDYTQTATGALLLDRSKPEIYDIDLSFENPLFKNAKSMENKYYKKGLVAGKQLGEKLKTYSTATSLERNVCQETEDQLLAIVRKPLHKALLFCKGFEVGLTEFSLEGSQALTSSRLGIASGVFQLWKDSARKFSHAQTKHQLLFCIAQQLVILSVL